jgi:hypothetical protein
MSITSEVMAFHIDDESERFPAKSRSVLGTPSLPTTRNHMKGKHTLSRQRAALKMGPQPTQIEWLRLNGLE